MTKEEFITKLRKKLSILETSEIDDIVEEYEGYIEEKKATGMSEKEAVKALGNIDEITKDLLGAYKIKEDYEEKDDKNIINKFIDGILYIIDSIINIFKNKSAKEIIKIVIEIFLIYILILIGKIPFSILKKIGYNTFSIFGTSIGDYLYYIWRLILDLIYFVLAIIFFFRALNERVIEPNLPVEEKEIKKSSIKKTNVKKEKVEVKEEKKKNDIIDIFANIVLIFIKFIVALLSIANACYIVAMSVLLALCVYLIIKGVTYFGPLIIALGLLIFGITFFELFIKFIFDKKQNITKFIVSILISFILGGVGAGIFAIEVAQTNIGEKIDTTNYKTLVETIPMEKNLIIPEFYEIEIDNTLDDVIKTEFKYNKEYIDIKVKSRKNVYNYDGYFFYHPEFNIENSSKTFNRFIKDIKNKTIYDYSDLVKIKIYVNKKTYNKLKENNEKYLELNDNYCYMDGDVEICEGLK